MPSVKISVPSVDVEGLCFVQQGNNVALFARKSTGDLEATPAMIFQNNGGGISVFLANLSAGSVFLNDSGLIHVEN